jgi:uncharacterized membrane protein YhaH (DUF805 family)
MKWYIKVLKQYADFSGRARRTEFWMFTLINYLISLVIGFIDGITGIEIINGGLGILGIIYSLALLIPGIAVSVRRLHDIGKSGWIYLLIFLPIIGWIILIVFFATNGNQGSNEYGDDPKGNFDEISEIGKE